MYLPPTETSSHFVYFFSNTCDLNHQAVFEPAFWGSLGDYKLEHLKLDEGPLPISASYSPCNHQYVPGVLSLRPTSLTSLDAPTTPGVPPPPGSLHGQLYCLNTVERVTTFDRAAAVSTIGSIMWQSIQSGAAVLDPSLVQQMIALVYCDLKQYKYHYWIGYPVMVPPVPYNLLSPPKTVETYFSSAVQRQDMLGAMEKWNQSSVFLLSCLSCDEVDDKMHVAASCHALSEWENLQSTEVKLFLVISDPSNAAEHPGWPLRNVLLLAAARWKVSMLRVLCLRTLKGRPSAAASLLFEVDLPHINADEFQPSFVGGWDAGPGGKPGPKIADLGSSMDPRRLATSAVDLNLQLMRWRAAPLLDVGSISTTRCLLLGAGTLGCSVARSLLGWGVRKITFVDNSRVAFSNPVRQSLFTFEDCLEGGKPKATAAADAVRRIFPDVECTGIEMDIPMPGHPPRSALEVEILLENCAELQQLIDEHDVVFMLLDTREARWLGTLMCAASAATDNKGEDEKDKGGKQQTKLAITAALGFDSFVVMRHGASIGGGGGGASSNVDSRRGGGNEENEENDDEEGMDVAKEKEKQKKKDERMLRLGCYFCSDIIGPSNSTRDRTMDQQCTVARPGLSGISGSLAVEIMAATLQHPMGVHAPPAGFQNFNNLHGDENDGGGEENDNNDSPPLGQVPHMIRGNLNGFSQTCLTGQAFPQCPACSSVVVEQYGQRGADFVLQAVSEPQYLEDLTGLTALQKEMEEAMQVVERVEEDRKKGGCDENDDGGGDDGDWTEL